MKQQEESMDKQQKYNPNAPETEEDEIIAGKLRIYKLLRQSKMPQELIDNSYPWLKNMGLTTESTSKDMESFELNVTSEHIKLMKEENLDKKDKRFPPYLDPELSHELDSEMSAVRELRKLKIDIAKEFSGLNEDNIDDLKISNQKNNKPKTTNMKTFLKFLNSIFLQFLLSFVALISWVSSFDSEYIGGSISMGIICSVCIIMIVWIEINKKNN
jgi:uncharacterized membrane protein (DUF485 family)